MILDRGVCSIFARQEVSAPGAMPAAAYVLRSRSWYGELNFETSTSRPTEGREERLTAARIRIFQDRSIAQGDVVVLRDINSFDQAADGEPVYRVTRAWHGTDDGGPTPITDLTLEVYEP